jgi:hypothetical protein
MESFECECQNCVNIDNYMVCRLCGLTREISIGSDTRVPDKVINNHLFKVREEMNEFGIIYDIPMMIVDKSFRLYTSFYNKTHKLRKTKITMGIQMACFYFFLDASVKKLSECSKIPVKMINKSIRYLQDTVNVDDEW